MKPRILIASALSVALLFAQGVALTHHPPAAGELSYGDQVTRGPMPTTLTDLIRQNVYLEELSFFFPASCAATVTVQDRQTSPQIIYSFTQASAATPTSIEWPVKRPIALGGVSWSTSNVCAIGYVWWSR